MADLAKNDALEGLVWDIWNEPDISIFWQRDAQQWIDLYIRTHKIIRYVSAVTHFYLFSFPTGLMTSTVRIQPSTLLKYPARP
jgi:hypothetical protein